MQQAQCSVCTNVRPVCPIIHIQDNGRLFDPNPVHNASPVCQDCLQILFATDRPCPICRQRFQEPIIAKCSYTWLRKTAKRKHLECPNKGYRTSPDDGNAYCDEHFDLGPVEMRLRKARAENTQAQRTETSRKRLADQCMDVELRKTQIAVKKVAGEAYFESLKRSTQVAATGRQLVLQAAQVQFPALQMPQFIPVQQPVQQQFLQQPVQQQPVQQQLPAPHQPVVVQDDDDMDDLDILFNGE